MIGLYCLIEKDFKMKTMKNILLILCLTSTIVVKASDYPIQQLSNGAFSSVSTSIGHLNSTSEDDNYRISSGSTQSYETITHFQFKSTSTIASSGSDLPCAATEGVSTTEDPCNTNSSNSGPRKVAGWGDNNAGDPGAVPLGDAVLPLLLLAAGFAIYTWRKKNKKSDSRIANPE